MARITVASYNVHWGYDKRGGTFDIVEVCRMLDADLLVMQESWLPGGEKSEADRAAAELGYEVVHAVMGPGRVGGRRPRLCAPGRATGRLALSMLARVPVLSTTELDMVRLPLDTSPRRLAVRVDLDFEGAPFTFVGTHLDHLSHGSPWQLRGLMAQLPAPDRPMALAGDMNMWGPVLSALLPGWRRAVRGRTWPNGRPHSQIDHIMVTGAVEAVTHDVLAAGRSDHLPVRATLQF